MIYFDNAATTKINEKALDALNKCSKEYFGNPSTHYSVGVKAKRMMEESRQKIANAIHSNTNEIIFTSGGTESNNIVLQSLLNKADEESEIIVSSIEHSSILNVLKKYENLKIHYIKPNKNGIIEASSIGRKINDKTYLIIVQMINNELGTIQPIKEISEMIKDKKIFLHVDAVQAIGHIEVNVKELNITTLSASAHKFNGPKGIGFLYTTLKDMQLSYGGSQEQGMRPGTENVPGIVSMAVALEESLKNLENNQKHIFDMVRYIEKELGKNPSVSLNVVNDYYHSIINLRVNNVSNEALINILDLKGVCISAGSACDGKNFEKSHVLSSLGLPEKQINESIRISLSSENTMQECIDFIKIFDDCIQKLQ